MRSSQPPARSSRESGPRTGPAGVAPRRRGFLAALLLGGAAAAAPSFSLPERSVVLPPALRESLPKDKLAAVPFPSGETLSYTIAWLQVEGGAMTLETQRETTPDGVPVHRITLLAESNDYVDKFYPVRDRYETWVDARDFQPLRFERAVKEGKYASQDLEEFDLTKRLASFRDGKTPLPEKFHDIISSFYFLRTQTFETGKAVNIDVFSRGRLYKVAARVLGKEKVETEAGTFDAWKIQPVMREKESEDDRNKGKLFLWFSDDARRLPVMARTVLPIGSVTARLKSVKTE